jgi:hypothetical protein
MKNWQTQLFLMRSGHLLWEDLRMTMVAKNDIVSRQNRDPYDVADDVRTAMYMDEGFLALQNNSSLVANKLIDFFLSASNPNPMLGLLGTYLLLIHYRRDPQRYIPQVEPNPDLISSLLNKLHDLMPLSADVVALRLMAREWVPLPPLPPVKSVPLFRFGAEVLLHAAASDPALVPEGSLLDVISENIYGDTVWTTWKSIELPARTRITSNFDYYSGKVMSLGYAFLAGTAPAAFSPPSWVELALIDTINAGRNGDGLTPTELVRRIGVSPHAIRSAIKVLMDRAELMNKLMQDELNDFTDLSKLKSPEIYSRLTKIHSDLTKFVKS